MSETTPAPDHAPAAIRPLTSTRPDLLVFEVVGQLHSTDMRWMADTVGEGFDRHGGSTSCWCSASSRAPRPAP